MKRYKVDYFITAEQDLADLAEYIAARSSEEIAMKFITALIEECESLYIAPHRGTKRRDLRPDMRVIGFKRVISILFRVEEELDLVVILGISYRGRQLDGLLQRILR